MFNIKQVPVLQLVGPDGTSTYPMDHNAADRLLRDSDANGSLRVSDAAGIHFHRVQHLYAAHLITQPDRSDASVELWQDEYATVSLYFVDPEAPQTAWRIHPQRLAAGAFARHAQNMIEGVMPIADIATPVSLAGLTEQGRWAATYHAGDGIIVATKPGTGMSAPATVAGDVAHRYIGDQTAGTTRR